MMLDARSVLWLEGHGGCPIGGQLPCRQADHSPSFPSELRS